MPLRTLVAELEQIRRELVAYDPDEDVDEYYLSESYKDLEDVELTLSRAFDRLGWDLAIATLGVLEGTEATLSLGLWAEPGNVLFRKGKPLYRVTDRFKLDLKFKLDLASNGTRVSLVDGWHELGDEVLRGGAGHKAVSKAIQGLYHEHLDALLRGKPVSEGL